LLLLLLLLGAVYEGRRGAAGGVGTTDLRRRGQRVYVEVPGAVEPRRRERRGKQRGWRMFVFVVVRVCVDPYCKGLCYSKPESRTKLPKAHTFS
jgi:hypothetical protein